MSLHAAMYKPKAKLVCKSRSFFTYILFLRDYIIGFVFLVLIVQYSSQKNHVAVFKIVWNESKQDRHLQQLIQYETFLAPLYLVFFEDISSQRWSGCFFSLLLKKKNRIVLSLPKKAQLHL